MFRLIPAHCLDLVLRALQPLVVTSAITIVTRTAPRQETDSVGSSRSIGSTRKPPNTLATADVTLIPGKVYRIVFQGVGSLLTGQLYDLEDLSAPIVTIPAEDSAYPSGVSGLVSFSRDATTTDVTFDNYLASVANPNADIAPAIRHPVAGTPQVVNRPPANRFTTLYPAASAISFTVRSFATNEINARATKLFLNSTDVSASLIPAPGSGTNITYVLSGGYCGAPGMPPRLRCRTPAGP